MQTGFTQLDLRSSDYNKFISTTSDVGWAQGHGKVGDAPLSPPRSDGPDPWIIGNGLTNVADVVSQRTVAWLHSGACSSELRPSDAEVKFLYDSGYLTTRDSDQEREVLGAVLRNARSRQTARAYTIILSYDCSFRCGYCTQRDVQRRGTKYLSQQMSDEMMDAMFRYIEEGPEWGVVLFGGEPFMEQNRSRVERLLEFTKSHDKTITAISNGYQWQHYTDLITPEYFENIQITLDGVPETHNRRRILAIAGEKGGSFWTIIENVKEALERGVQIVCRSNIDSNNIGDLMKLEALLKEEGLLDHPKFGFYPAMVVDNDIVGNATTKEEELLGIRAVHTYQGSIPSSSLPSSPCGGGGSESSSSSCGDSEGGCGTGTQSAEPTPLVQLGKRATMPFLPQGTVQRIQEALFDGKLVSHSGGIGCGAYSTMECIDNFGDVYACWDTVGHPEHRVGQLSLDKPGVMEPLKATYDFRARLEDLTLKDCILCPYVLYHGSGCAVKARTDHGTFDHKACDDYPWLWNTCAREAYSRGIAAGKTPFMEEAVPGVEVGLRPSAVPAAGG